MSISRVMHCARALPLNKLANSNNTLLLLCLVKGEAVHVFKNSCPKPLNCQNVYNTMYSQAVTHPSTNMARCCLTAVIRRELVLSTWYGRTQ